MIYYNQKNKKSFKFKRIIILISVLVVLPIFFSSIQGDTAFFANYNNSKENFDIPSLRDSSVYYRNTNGDAFDVFVSGDYAYIADYYEGLAVIDISDPTNPGTPVYKPTTGKPNGVYISGDYAYIADDDNGLAVIDISDPTNPGTPVYEDTNGLSLDVHVSGDYAYVADYDEGLAVFDISDPTNPGIPVYEDTFYAEGVYIDGDYAYIADGGAGLAVIDISDPTNPGTPVYEATSGSAYDVFVSGDYAYIADGGAGLAVIDISDPTNPGTPVYEDTFYAEGVYIDGNYAYIADAIYGLAVIDISDPTNPGTPVYEDTDGQARGLCVEGNYAFVSDGGSGLAVIDISEEINPSLPIYEDTDGRAKSIYVSGDYAYIADYDQGLAVIDISDPTNPGTPVYEATTGYFYDVFVSGDYAYIADYYEGLAVIDISDPTNPGTPIYKDTTGHALGVYVSGDYAYIADGNAGLAVIDISDPTNPGTPIYEDTDEKAYGVCVEGDYVYIADGNAGLAVIDISNPLNPGTPVYEDTGGDARNVYVSGDYAYLATGIGLEVIDISDPTNPGIPVREYTYGYPSDIFVSGDFAYIADNLKGLAVFDISDPTNPGTPYFRATTGEALGVYVTGDYAFIADADEGFAVIQIRKRIDMIDPIITSVPSDLFIESGYTGLSISWTATDLNPDKYTIELQSSGIVAGPTAWASGIEIIYNVPDGLTVGEYFYTVNFTDDYDNFITDTVKITVQDTEDPVITDTPSDLTVELGYAGQSISWTATDPNPNTYTIELQGTGIVRGPTAWVSGVEITYNIPNGFTLGVYIYTVNFTDDYGNFITDSVTFTVGDTTNPTITSAPSDLTVELGYAGQSISWTATDPNPNTYTIELQGTGIVRGPTAWVSGVEITYNIPNGFTLGVYIYTVNFTDDYGNFITDSVLFTVGDTTNPTITNAPSDLTVDLGYTGQSISWTATDPNPNTYTIELQGTGIVAGPSMWSSGVAITYNVPDGLAAGDYFYTVNFTDDDGNFIIDTIKITVKEEPPVADDPQIPFGNYYLIFLGIGVAALVLIQKRRKL